MTRTVCRNEVCEHAKSVELSGTTWRKYFKHERDSVQIITATRYQRIDTTESNNNGREYQQAQNTDDLRPSDQATLFDFLTPSLWQRTHTTVTAVKATVPPFLVLLFLIWGIWGRLGLDSELRTKLGRAMRTIVLVPTCGTKITGIWQGYKCRCILVDIVNTLMRSAIVARKGQRLDKSVLVLLFLIYVQAKCLGTSDRQAKPRTNQAKNTLQSTQNGEEPQWWQRWVCQWLLIRTTQEHVDRVYQ